MPWSIPTTLQRQSHMIQASSVLRVHRPGPLATSVHDIGTTCASWARRNLIDQRDDPTNNLAGPLLFTTITIRDCFDGIFYWTAKV